MNKIIIYCHGYGSSKESSKVHLLSQAKDAQCIAFDIDIDPMISVPRLKQQISDCLCRYPNAKPVIVGTSLGGWYAAKMAAIFKCRSVIFNPSINPKTSLLKYGISQVICDHYENFEFNQDATYFIALDDHVIDHANLLSTLSARGHIPIRATGGHRFHENFNLVIEHLSEI